MRVSHETIYQSIYVQGRGELRRDLASHLRTGRSLRKPRRQHQAYRQAQSQRGKQRIKDMVDSNTIIGEPITMADGTLILPVSKGSRNTSKTLRSNSVSSSKNKTP